MFSKAKALSVYQKRSWNFVLTVMLVEPMCKWLSILEYFFYEFKNYATAIWDPCGFCLPQKSAACLHYFQKPLVFFFCTRPEMHQFGRKNEKGKKNPLHLFPIIHFFESRMFLGKNHQNTVLSALCVGSFNQLLWLSSLSLFQRLGLVLLKYFGFLIYLMFLFMNQH